MTIERAGIPAALALALALAVPAAMGEQGDADAPSAEAPQFSRAETILWTTDQLHMIERPVRLLYRFSKTGTYEEGFEDTVEVQIHALHEDGTKAVRVEFFTGDRNHFVPERERTNVNPVLGVFLQGDVYEMNRLTDGHWRYFHRAIKFALADAAIVESVEVEFGGRRVPAQRVQFAPYLDDPRRSQMEDFAAKQYSITISDAIPGYLYEIHSVIPGKGTAEQPDAPPLIEERLTLNEVQPLAAP